MLQIKDISKEYRTGDLVQRALDHVSLNLRDNEFVAILGPSGSGKTTLLNVIGGLDRYDSGDLVINGVSTKKYSDRDWDSYRNHTIGFVFQSYNLIMHQSVLANVELALTISGISGAERRKRAEDALKKVGLGEQMHKKPAQMSGGQMQRVAIARALVNDPDIVLADEPTGALDSETSIQVMNLLQEVARDRLVVMVTHNPELASRYATRTVTIKDGHILSDTDPFIIEEENEKPPVHKRLGKASMSFLTALSLSFNNLKTKKARTILVSFAGSIGIIGIALILALSNGANRYIKAQEEETLSQYPLEIEKTGYDLTSLMSGSDTSGGTLMGGRTENIDTDRIGVQDVVDTLFSGVNTNDLKSLKKFLDDDGGGISQYVNGIEYDYDVTPQIYRIDGDQAVQINPNNLFDSLATGKIDMSSMMSGTLGSDFFSALPVAEKLYKDTYDVKAGHWPASDDELVLVLNNDGKVSDLLLYELGLKDDTKLKEKIQELSDNGNGIVSSSSDTSSGDEETYSYDKFLGMTFKLVNNADLYTYDSQMGVWTDRSDDSAYVNQLASTGKTLKIAGIVQPKEGSASTALNPGLAYRQGLITDIIDADADSQIVKEQKADPEKNVLTGNLFSEDNENSGLDFSKLVTVDEDALKNAFNLDGNDANFDLSGLAKNMDFGSLDISGSDMSQFQAGMPGAESLQSALPSLSTEDIVSLAEKIKFTGTKEQVQKLFSSLTDGFLKYSAGSGGADYSKLSDSFSAYMQSDSFRKIMRDFVSGILEKNSGAAISQEELRQMIMPLISGYVQYMINQAGLNDPEKVQEYLSDPSQLQDLLTSFADSSNISRYLNDPSSGAAALLQTVSDTISEKIRSINVSEEDLTAVGTSILKGYDSYASVNGGPLLSALPDAFGKYLETDGAKKMISDAAGSMIDTKEFEKAVSDALSQTMAQVSSQIGAQISAAVQSVMNSVAGQLTKTLQSAAANAGSEIAENMQSLFTLDPQTFANAIKVNMSAGQIRDLMTSLVSGRTNSYEDNLSKFGYADKDNPSAILIYSKDFDAKNSVTSILDQYNSDAEKAGNNGQVIHYTDMIAAMLSSVTRIINAISYILIGFVGISLVVSSIMIGVITYISVLERRKEIGILRAMGASKHNVAQVFNAETFITGLLAGIIGVAVTVILTYPVNIVIRKVTNIVGIRAALPPQAALLLILLSIGLTMIAGLIPAGKASRSDPVAALRTE